MAKAGRASTPVDLMTYEPEDEQPSVFLLRQSPRQSMLTIFNWTDKPAHSASIESSGSRALRQPHDGSERGAGFKRQL